MNDRMCLRNKVALVTGAGWPMTALGVRREKAAPSSGCKSPPATAPAGSTGAVMEVTKWLKPLVSVSRIGDSASVQAAT